MSIGNLSEEETSEYFKSWGRIKYTTIFHRGYPYSMYISIGLVVILFILVSFI